MSRLSWSSVRLPELEGLPPEEQHAIAEQYREAVSSFLRRFNRLLLAVWVIIGLAAAVVGGLEALDMVPRGSMWILPVVAAVSVVVAVLVLRWRLRRMARDLVAHHLEAGARQDDGPGPRARAED